MVDYNMYPLHGCSYSPGLPPLPSSNATSGARAKKTKDHTHMIPTKRRLYQELQDRISRSEVYRNIIHSTIRSTTRCECYLEIERAAPAHHAMV